MLNFETLLPRPKPHLPAIRTAANLLPPNAAIGEWDEFLSAVKTSLRLAVGRRLDATSAPQWHETAGQVRASVLHCVAALDQLHTMLTQELGRRQQLELEVFDVQTTLAQARVQLAGTEAGERRARHLALHDSLTSLPNRGFFRQRLDDALTHAEPQRRVLAVLYLDLDGFKPVNDTHGHDAGDELLRIIAARLARAIRAEDMVSRLGGDEFACLLSDLPSREHLCHLACKLFDAVSAPVQIGALKLSVHPSIGIATCPADGATAETLLKSADTAMYRAKRHQTGYAFFDQCAVA
jgi:diguanylate cyclase (GGDEF)-like protein